MAGDTLWHRPAVSTFQLGQRMLALDRQSLEVVELDALDAGVLGRCTGARPLTDHAAAAWAAGLAPSPAPISGAVQTLASLGLLRPLKSGADSEAPAPAHPIRTVAIVTADRPAALTRALEALDRPRSLPLDVLVIDNSLKPAAQTRSIVAKFRSPEHLNAHYVGQAEAAALRRSLAGRGIPMHVLDAGLAPGSIGNGRNIALLLGVGRPVLMQDDDVVADVWATEGNEEDLIVGGHVDLRAWRFFDSREAVRKAVTPWDTDIASAHARVLGQSLDRLIAAAIGHVQYSEACAHMTAALADAADRPVRVTFAGVAGDAGRYCSHGIILRPGPLRQQLWDNEGQFDTATTSREVAVVAPRLIVTHDATCLGYCMGVDATALLPPFMPAGRNEDGVWGATLAFADTRTLFAHLPVGVRHESDRPAAYEEPMPSARYTRISDFLLFVINRVARGTFARTPADRLKHLGRLFAEAARLPDAEFRALLGESKLTVMCADLSQAEAAAADPACSPHWRHAVDEYQRTFRQSVIRPDYFLPIEFQDGTLDEGFARAQQFVGRFGELLTWWPEIWEAARQMNEERRDAWSIAARPARSL